MTRLPQAFRKRGIAIFCAVLLGGLALSASRSDHRRGLSQSPATSPHSHSVDLKWNASTSRVVGYSVYRSEEAGGPYTKLTSTPVPRTDYTDHTVQAGHSYFYTVTTVDNKGHESLYSNEVKAVVPST